MLPSLRQTRQQLASVARWPSAAHCEAIALARTLGHSPIFSSISFADGLARRRPFARLRPSDVQNLRGRAPLVGETQGKTNEERRRYGNGSLVARRGLRTGGGVGRHGACGVGGAEDVVGVLARRGSRDASAGAQRLSRGRSVVTVFRVEKNANYTVMSNEHLRNRDLSLKAKGLLSQMLSLPEEWDYSLEGLSRINREGVDAIRTGVRELEEHGYLERRRLRDGSGRLAGTEYVVHERAVARPSLPESDEPALVFQCRVPPCGKACIGKCQGNWK